MRELLFSVTKKDFEFQTFKASGKGGQRRNKVETACRYVHRASGAVGEATESRKQIENKRMAFRRCVESEKFQKWLKIEIAKRNGEYAELERRVKKAVDEAMKPENIKIEEL
jgi:protein subunit release factor B